MKKLLISCTFMAAAAGAYASDYGCKVLLCLANPASNGGPRGIAQCVPPINQLFDDLSHGRGFPTCDLADGNDGSSYAVQLTDPYDPCPTPLRAADPASYVAEGKRAATGGFTITSSPRVSQPASDYSTFAGARACVGTPLGSVQLGGQDDGYSATVFDKVVWQNPQSPRAIDVYVNRAWYQRIHW